MLGFLIPLRAYPLAGLVLIALVLATTACPAQNIVTNPGAETGDFTGWTRGGTHPGQPLIDPSTHIPAPPNHSGNHRFGISVGYNTADIYQYQTLNVTPSRRYAVSLWYTKRDGTDESLEVTWANGSFGAPESTLYTVGGSVEQQTWAQLSGESFVPSQNTATLVIHYRHAFASNIASIHIDDISVTDIGQGPTPTLAPTTTPTRTGGPTLTPTPTTDPNITPQPLTNPDFEDGFANGVANGWTSFRVSGGGFWKPNELLGRLGGGIYGCFGPSGVPGYNCIDEYESIRMSAKSYLISLDRYNQVGHIEDVLGSEVITIAKWDAEAPDIYPDGNTWQTNAEADGARFADWYYTEWIQKNPSFKPDALYGLNEPSVNNAADIVKVARFELGFTRRCQQLGFKAIVMNNSVGTPGDITLFYLPEIVELLAEADYVGYHAYGQWGAGWMCTQGANPYTFRWQTIADHYISQGWRFPAVIYTEAGQYWWKDAGFTSQQIRDDLICYEARERNEEWWSLGINYFVTGAWPGAWDAMHIGDGNQTMIIDGCRATNQAHPLDAHGGIRAQEMGGAGEAFDIGIRQNVPTTPGVVYEFRGWFKYEYDYGWPNRAIIRVGWDPTGQTANPVAPTVQWSTDLIQLGPNNPIYPGPWETDLWYEYRTAFHASSANASLWIRATEPAGTTQARVYVDDVAVLPLGAIGEESHFSVY